MLSLLESMISFMNDGGVGMVFARIAAAAIAALFLWCATAGAGGPLRHVQKHGYWAGGAYTDDRTGAFYPLFRLGSPTTAE